MSDQSFLRSSFQFFQCVAMSASVLLNFVPSSAYIVRTSPLTPPIANACALTLFSHAVWTSRAENAPLSRICS